MTEKTLLITGCSSGIGLDAALGIKQDVAGGEHPSTAPVINTAAAAMIFVKAPIWTSFYESTLMYGRKDAQTTNSV